MSTSASHTFGSLASSSAGGRRGNSVDVDEADNNGSDRMEALSIGSGGEFLLVFVGGVLRARAMDRREKEESEKKRFVKKDPRYS